nr:helicase-related protein [Desulfobulbus alkaliphilus]
METAPVSPWPHQEVVARRLIESWPYSFLLCDEVGLGKTIEAGLAIRSLVLSGLARRVLITAPASLTIQWQREMATKFLLPFGRALTGASIRHEYLFPAERVAAATGLYQPNFCIVSTGLLARKDRRNDIAASRRFDIALVDEAHYARRQNPAAADNRRQEPRYGRLYATIRDEVRKRSEALWLATATPMQLDWIEVFDLIHLSDRVGSFQDDPTLTWGYYDILGRLVHNQPVRDEEWQFLRRVINAVGLQDPLLQKYMENAVIDGRIRACSRQWLEQGRLPRGRDLVNIRRLIFAAAPLSRVMLRHTRALLEIYKSQGRLNANLAKREILPIPRIVFTTLEQQAYDKLEEYCEGLARQMQAATKDQSSVFNLKFLLSLLRLRFASSLYAIRETIRRRLERVAATLASFQQPTSEIQLEDYDVDADDEDGEGAVIETLLKNRTEQDLRWEQRQLKQLLETLGDLHEMPSKMQTFLDVMDSRRQPGGRIKQTVVFTRFFDTLTDIVTRLRRIDPTMLIGTYSGRGGSYVAPATGKMISVERDAIKQRFMREEIDVLVCTDAAAEGLNLQTADMLINFDLPWNPMKVEQRIGRIDRIGQKFEQIFVLNLCYAGSVEETVYGRLMKRLQKAAGVVGSQQISMLPITEEDFRLLANGTLTEQELEAQARDRIIIQQQRTASMEIPAQDLYDIYLRLGQQHRAVPSPVSLGEMWQVLTESSFLRGLGCQVSADGRLMTIKGITGVADDSLLTVDRDLYDKGLPGESRSIHFASYGDPIFDAILEMVEQFKLPDSVRRLKVQSEGIGGEMVGYAVLEDTTKNAHGCRLIRSLAETESLVLAEDDAALLDEASGNLLPALQRILAEERGPIRATEQVARYNRRAALAQQRFSLYIAHRLLSSGDINGDDPFYSKIAGLTTQFDSGDMVPVYNLSVTSLQEIQDELVFDIALPAVGRTTNIRVPALLANSAIDAACRLADSFRRRRGDINVGEVLERLGREIDRCKAQLR